MWRSPHATTAMVAIAKSSRTPPSASRKNRRAVASIRAVTRTPSRSALGRVESSGSWLVSARLLPAHRAGRRRGSRTLDEGCGIDVGAERNRHDEHYDDQRQHQDAVRHVRVKGGRDEDRQGSEQPAPCSEIGPPDATARAETTTGSRPETANAS